MAIAAGASWLSVGDAIAQAQGGNPASTGSQPPLSRKDVLPILQRSCQQCHHPGTSAPMSLDDLSGGAAVGALDQAEGHPSRDAAMAHRSQHRRIPRRPVALRSGDRHHRAPGWTPADRRAGPPTRRRREVFAADSEWTYGEPDLVVRMEKGFRIPADGPDFIPEEIVDPKLTEDRYVKWVQIIPDAQARRASRARVRRFARRHRHRRPRPRHGLERRQQPGPDRIRRRQRRRHLPGRHERRC